MSFRWSFLILVRISLLTIGLAASLARADQIVDSAAGDRPAGSAVTSTPTSRGPWEYAGIAAYNTFYKSCAAQSGSSAANAAAENAYLHKLAKSRASALDCVKSQVTSVADDPEKSKALANDLATKISLIMALRRANSNLESTRTYQLQLGLAAEKGSKYFDTIQQQNSITAAEEAVLASIPFIQLSHVRDFVKAQLALFNEGAGPQVSPDAVLKSVQSNSGARSALRWAQADLSQEVSALENDDLSTATRESLIQDHSLAESYPNHLESSDSDKVTACHLDAMYGKGAQARDATLLAAQVGLTAISLGSSGLASAALASTRTSAALRGLYVSQRATNILSRFALASVDLSVAATQAHKACSGGSQTQASADNSCQNFKIEELNKDNCYLSQAFVALGLVAVAAPSVELLRRFPGVTKVLESKAEVSQIKSVSTAPAPPPSLGGESRIESAAQEISRELSPEQKKAVMDAHNVGAGESGKDGQAAAINNYTNAQLKQKASILKRADFSVEERRALVEKGIVGLEPQSVEKNAIHHSFGTDEKYDLLFNRTGTKESNAFRDAFVRGDLGGDNQFIAYSAVGESKRWAAKIIRKLPNGTLEVELAGTHERKILTAKELLSAKLSSISKDYFNPPVALKPAPSIRHYVDEFVNEPSISTPKAGVATKQNSIDGHYVSVNHSISDRTGATIYEAQPGQQVRLPAGQYTYIRLRDGRFRFGRVHDPLEFGVKHFHLANGDEVVTAGELHITDAGKYEYNLLSGTFSQKLVESKGVDPDLLVARTASSLHDVLGTRGSYAHDRVLLPTGQVSRREFTNYCQTANFFAHNIQSCCEMVRICQSSH